MWMLLFACVGPPPMEALPSDPMVGPMVLSEAWGPLGLVAEGVDVVRDRPDSLLVRGPDAQLDAATWQAALEAAGWRPQAASVGRRGDMTAIRYVRGEKDPIEDLVFGATRYEGRATHSLTVVEVQ
jgi:hypothetical protein